MREQLEKEVIRLKRMVSSLASAVETAVRQAVAAAAEPNSEMAAAVITRDDAIDRMQGDKKEQATKIFNADWFLMSTNAITLDGELINIDGTANRICYLCFGPEHVLVIAGMNKVVTDVPSGIARVRNMATPPNTTRLHKDTPCARFGRCMNCLEPDCICNQILVTRRSGQSGRIHVILVGEELGY